MSATAQTWYAATATATPERPRLTGTVEADVCVVGAGITGCSAALHLAERGYSVVLLDAARVGHGASGRSGGQIIAGYNQSQAAIAKLVGAADARRLWALSEEAIALTRALIARHGIACDLTDGHLTVGEKPRHARELREMMAEWQAHGRDGLEYWDAAETRARLASPRYTCGVRDAHGGHLHPLNYTLGLAAAAEAAGARIHERSPVTAWEGGDAVVARTPHGQVRARHLLLSGNAYLWDARQPMAHTIMPVTTYIAATEPLGAARARALIPGNEAVADCNWAINYFRLSADHRLLFGGDASARPLPPDRIATALRARMLSVFPQLAGVRIDHAWGGKVAITLNRLPHFGWLGKNVLFAHGYSGHGIALAGLGGKLAADAIAGQAERFDVFARIPHAPFPGGPLLRAPLLYLATTWARLRDML